jgi:hypothetical protein
MRFARARGFNDFLSPYIQSKAWTRSLDPYSQDNLVALWPPEVQPFPFVDDLKSGTLLLKRGIPTAYPLPTLVLLAPFAILPWPIAHELWLVLTLSAFGVTLFSLLRVVGYHFDDTTTYLFLALAVALAPFHSGLATGNIVIVVVGLCAAAVLTATNQRDSLAGVLTGVAVCLKPQIGLVVLIYFLLKRRWKIVSFAIIVVAVLATTAIGRLAASHTSWVANYLLDCRMLFAKGSLGDFTEGNGIRFGLVNLQLLTYIFLRDGAPANLCALIVSGILAAIWLLLLRRRACKRIDLLDLSTLLVLSLMPLYHRFYDASLLIFPLAWSLKALSNQSRRPAGIALFLMLLFLVPAGSMLEQAQHASWTLHLQSHWWWTDLIMPCQVWAILLLALACMAAMRRPLRHRNLG